MKLPARIFIQLSWSQKWRGTLLAGLIITALSSCGESVVRQVEIPTSTLTEELPDTSGQKDPKKFAEAIKIRERQGDTIAIDHEKLENLLPNTIAEYTLDISKSSTFETRNYTFSEATKVFYNREEDYIEFIAGDYVADPDFFKVNLQRYNLAQGVEIEGIREEKRIVSGLVPGNVQDYFTWSLYNSQQKIARVYLGIDYRYFVTIEATGLDDFLDLEKVKSWLKWSEVFGK